MTISDSKGIQDIPGRIKTEKEITVRSIVIASRWFSATNFTQKVLIGWQRR
jgi:hypothetical protein